MDRSNLIAAKDAAIGALLPLREKLMEAYGKVENTYKQDKSVVTELDMWAEHEIKDALRSFDDSIGFLGEEHGAEGSEHLRWLIDPIDGTEQFIRGIPMCGNVICLVEGKEILATVIYNFVAQDIYWAVKGGGAWMNDTQLSVSKRPLERSFIDVGVNSQNQANLDVLISITASIKGVTRYHCSSYTASMVASGRIEGRVTMSGKGGPWDYAPGALLITEAGGMIEHMDGSAYDYLNTDNFVCGTSALVDFVRGLHA